MDTCARSALAVCLTASMLAACGGDSGRRAYTVGGTVSGLAGSGLVLTNGSGQSLAVAANGPFTFTTPVMPGAAYHVSVSGEPDTNPKQRCSVADGDGTSDGTPVVDVSVHCIGPYVYVPASDVDYTTDTTTLVVYAYTLDVGTGALMPISGSPFATQTPQPGAGTVLYVDAGKHFAYLAGPNGLVNAYAIDAATAALAPLAGTPFHFGSGSLQLDPTGRFAYDGVQGSDGAAGSIAAASIDPASGALLEVASGPTAVASGGPNALSLSSDGRFLYTTSRAVTVNGAPRTGLLSGFSIDPSSGGLTPLPGSPWVTADQPGNVILDPQGRFALVATSGGIWACALDASSGALSPSAGNPFAVAGTFAGIDPQGRFLVTARTLDPAGDTGPLGLWVYGIATTTGALTAAGGNPTVTSLMFGAQTYSDPTGRFVYAVELQGSPILGYTVSSAGIGLTPIAGSPFGMVSQGAQRVEMTFDPSGHFVYVQTGSYKGPPGNLFGNTVDPHTGALVPGPVNDFPGSAIPGSITFVAVN